MGLSKKAGTQPRGRQGASSRDASLQPRRLRAICAITVSLSALAAQGSAIAESIGLDGESVAQSSSNGGHSTPVKFRAQADERMGPWLVGESAKLPPTAAPLYWPGLMWLSVQARAEQAREQAALQRALQALIDEAPGSRSATRQAKIQLTALLERLSRLPVTGRVSIPLHDPWLMQAHPASEPIVRQGDEVVLPARPSQVRVIAAAGPACQARHHPEGWAQTYLRACAVEFDGIDRAWLIQPDGRALKLGIGAWNAAAQPHPAPGAWIWQPPAALDDHPELERRIAFWLATQGPSQDLTSAVDTDGARSDAIMTPSLRPRTSPTSASDWGVTGLLQTPTARLPKSGQVGMTISHTAPYTHVTATLSPFDRLELGFRYSNLSNQRYSEAIAGDQSYKDKSSELKLLLMRESQSLPAVALGLRDPGGTGLFGGEYVVASKRWHDFDFSLGLGWGYLGRRANLGNPLGLFGERFKTRGNNDFGQGGTANLGSLFTGRTAVFGGVQWHTPMEGLLAKVELDGNPYRQEPFGADFSPRSPFNFGLVWRKGPLDVSLGLQRGKQASITFALASDLTTLRVDKVNLPAPVRVVPEVYRTPSMPLLPDQLARQLREQTGWEVRSIEQYETHWVVNWEESQGHAWPQRLDRAMALIDREAPAQVQTIQWSWHRQGVLIGTRTTQRAPWLKAKTQWSAPADGSHPAAQENIEASPGSTELRPTSEAAPPRVRRSDTGGSAGSPTYARKDPSPGSVSATVSLTQHLGGPDGYLFAVTGNLHGQLDLWTGAWIQGTAQARLVDNYDRFRYTADSSLPRVRTNIREYVTTSPLTIPWLQASQLNRWADGVYTLAYAGLLEPMFAGVGAEALWRPAGSRFGIGIDINRVGSRSFEQDFQIRDYRVDTGQLSLYWDTGWKGVQAQIAAGRYLAGDKGATVLLSRRFSNGVTMGAWATKTNISAEQFGEGSFDKGVYLTIPFDAFTTGWSRQALYVPWQPLIRDGGARLSRGLSLWSLTQVRDERAWRESNFGR
jgi:hypothetical protein